MKKAKRCKGKHMLMWKDLYNIQFFQRQGRALNAAKTQIQFFIRRNEVSHVVIYDHTRYGSDCIVRWHDGRYFTFSHNSQSFQAKPFRMTLAKYKQLNDFEK